MKERGIEKYLVERVKALGGEVRKVQWVGRKSAPDRLVMLPSEQVLTYDVYLGEGRIGDAIDVPVSFWVELKNPDTIKAFPANPHERAQHREHERMRAMGQRVEVIGTKEQVDEVLR